MAEAGGSEAWMAEGRALIAEGQYAEALTLFERAIAALPDSADAWRGKGGALAGLERYEEAQAATERVLELNPSDARAWYNRGYTFYCQEQLNEAMDAFEHSLALDSTYEPAWFWRASVLLGLNRCEDALVCCDRALALDPNDGETWFLKGNVLDQLDRPSDALLCFERALALDPSDAFAWHNKGNELYALERYEEALVCYDHAIGLHGEHAPVWSSKGYALGKLGRHDEALAAVEEAIRLAPENGVLWEDKGQALAVLQRGEEAAQAFSRARDLEPEEYEPAMGYAAALFRLRRYDEAVAAYDYVLRLDPENDAEWRFAVLRFKGESLEHLGRIEEALSCYEQSLQSEPKDAEVWGNKGKALYQLHHYEDAISAFDEALRLQPEIAWLWYGKAAALFELKQYVEALEACERAIDANATYTLAWQLKGAIKFREGQYVEALEAYDGALQSSQQSKEAVAIWLSKCEVLCRMGRYGDAHSACDEAARAGGADAEKGDMERVAEMRRYIDRITSRTTADQRLRLRDGRWLGYIDYGDPTGQVVICCHGLPGSRLEFALYDEELLLTLGVRIIAPDRPGMGLSDYQRKRTLLDWPDDVVQLADHLGIERFAALGVSSGGAYAAACAYKLPERVTKLGLVSSVAPPEKESGVQWVGLHNSRAALLQKMFPLLLMGPVGGWVANKIRNHPVSYVRAVDRRLPQPDQVSDKSAIPVPVMQEAAVEPFRQGMRGYVRDQALVTGRTWGFRLEDIVTDSYIWYGEQDSLALPEAGRYLAQALTHSHVKSFRDEGHIVLEAHLQEIVTTLKWGNEAATPTT